MKKITFYILTVIQFLFTGSNLFAQPRSILFDHYTTADGLSNNIVWDIHKTRQGYIWLGTQDGLCRFDGKSFKTFRYDVNDSNSLSNNTVYDLLEDQEGYMWVGTFSGLNRYNPAFGKLVRIKSNDQANAKRTGIGAIAEAKSDSTILVGTNGLFFVNKKTLTLEPVPGKLNEEVFAADGGIKSILYESDEKIWIGGNKGLIQYSRKNGSYAIYYSPQKNLLPGKIDFFINNMLLDKKGNLWIASWGLGLLEFDTAQKKFINQYLPEKNDRFVGTSNIIHSISQTNFPGQEDIIWLACNDASFTAFNTQEKTFYNYKVTASDAKNGTYGGCYSLFFNKSDGMWIGGEKGFYRYDMRMQVFDNHPFGYNFPNACLNYVLNAYADPLDTTGNTLWIGTWNCGVHKYNIESHEFTDVSGWLKSQIKTTVGYNPIIRDKKGVIWIGSTSDGLLSADEGKKTVTRFYPPENKPVSVKRVSHLLEDKNENLWAGAANGLYRMDAARKNFIEIKWNVADSIRKKLSYSINGICSDNDGNTWFTAQNNYDEFLPVIGKIKKGQAEATIFYHLPGDKSSFPDVKHINNIVCDEDNRLWCASWNGLVTWKADESKPLFKIYTTNEGLLNNFINKVTTDASGNIWCGTISGLSVLLKKNGKFRNFNNAGLEQDNVSDIFFNVQQRSLIIGDWGKLHTLKPDELVAEAEPPQIIITDFKVFGKPAPEVKKNIFDKAKIVLAYNRNVVTIDFAALTFYNPSQVQYAFKMEGVDNDWIYTKNNSVSYNLSNGNYVFQVKAMNAEGVWNEKGTSMQITVNAPFWKKTWFILLICLVVASLLYGLYKYRINQIKKLQKVRNSISQNLHDDIGASLSNINILNELAKRNLTQPEKSKEYLAKASDDIQRISESLSDIVWNINPRYDDLQNLFVRMKRYAADMLDGKNIHGEFNFPSSDLKANMGMIQRRDFYLIFKEAVNNLVKYSGATDAEIKVSVNDRQISLLVKDNGKGFDESVIKKGNGLTNMTQRAEASKGELHIFSEPGKGTTITLSMPLE